MRFLLLLSVLSLAAHAEEFFDVSTAGTTAKLPAAGGKGTLVVAFTLKDGAHISDEAPLKLSIGGEHVKAERAQYTLADSVAKKAAGDKYAAPRFELPFTAEVGASKVEAKLSFFVCTASQCFKQSKVLVVPLELQ